ncbi:MAG: ABC-three component system protein [Pseudomonadota bacterium]|nr:ABC-three component system protein [Pseudomonadota bacterium]
MSQATTLIKKLSDEIEGEITTADFIDRLVMFKSGPTGDGSAGVASKLKSANRTQEAILAETMMECFSKLLMKYEHFNSGQELFSLFLCRIYDVFTHKILPECHKLKPSEIDDIISKDIVDPILSDVGEGCEHFVITHAEIRGMIYWLAERCFVRWNDSQSATP